jgi:hypothetical protein
MSVEQVGTMSAVPWKLVCSQTRASQLTRGGFELRDMHRLRGLY